MIKFKNKIIITFILILGSFVILLGVYTSGIIKEINLNTIETNLSEEVDLVINMIKVDDNLFANESKLEDLILKIAEGNSRRITVIDNTGEVLVDSLYDKNEMDNHLSRPEVAEAEKIKVGKEIRYSDTLGLDMLYLAKPLYYEQELEGYIRLALPLKNINASIQALWSNLIIFLSALLIVVIIISTMLIKRFTSPIEKITDIAQKIKKRDYSQRLKIDRRDEVGILGEAINSMADSLEEQMKLIEENERKLTTVLNNMSSGVMLIETDGRIVFANPAIEWFIGNSIYSFTDRKYHEVFPQSKINELIRKTFDSGDGINSEIEVNHTSKKILDCTVVPIFDNKNSIKSVLVMLIDITKIKHLENMKADFVANVSHELKTPITSLKGFTETLLDGAIEDKQTTKEFLEIINKESDRLHRLVSDLLDLSKIEQNKDILNIRKTNLELAIKNTIKSMQPEITKRDIDVVENLQEIYAYVDEDRFKQVIINLITNAISYTPEKGGIIICLAKLDNSNIQITIKDTGIGIPKNSIPHLFERFYRVDKARTRDSGGTGLGLAIVKHIVELHGGSISVESEVSRGTKFTILLPNVSEDKYE